MRVIAIRNSLETIMNAVRKEISPPLIISTGWCFGAYDLVRALGMSGIRSWVASSQPNDVAFYSRYCERRLILPPFDIDHEADILNAVQGYARIAGDRPVLYYASDPELWFVWQYRNELEPYCRFLLPPDSMLERMVNKALFGDLAATYALPIPMTRTAQTFAEVQSMIDSIEFPCIVKPAFSQDWIWDSDEQRARFGPYKKALRRFESRDTLLEFCEALPDRRAGFIIQSYIDGRDENILSFHGYFDVHSTCLGSFIGRKIRTYPSHTGGSAYVQTLSHDALGRLSIDHLQRIQFKGIVKIDYKWDYSMNEFKILEINPRYNLWQLLGAYAGVNLAHIAYKHQHGQLVEEHPGYRADERLIFFKQDLRGFLEGYRKSGEWTTLSYIRSLLKRKRYRVFDPKDPVPFLHSAANFVKRNSLRLFRMAPKDGQAPKWMISAPTGMFRQTRKRKLAASKRSATTIPGGPVT
jgi:D-aspartate ligase